MEFQQKLLDIVSGRGSWDDAPDMFGSAVQLVAAPSFLVALGLGLALTGTMMLAVRRGPQALRDGMATMQGRLRRIEVAPRVESPRCAELRRLRQERQAKVAEVPCLGPERVEAAKARQSG